MVRTGLLGAGFIGKVHAASVFRSDFGTLNRIYDVRPEAAQELAVKYGASVASTPEELINSPEIDALIIASSTDTHADLLIKAVEAGKPVYCEKPIDLSIDRLREVADVVRGKEGRVFMGFSRRFDRSYADVQARVPDVGNIELVQMITRGPQLPPISYQNEPMSPGFEDGVKAQQIAEAAVQSLHAHRPVKIEYTI